MRYLLVFLLFFGVGCANLKITPEGKVTEIETTGDSKVEVEICDTIEETLNDAGVVTSVKKQGCQIILSEGGHAGDGILATVIQGMSIFVSIFSIAGVF